MNQIFDTKYGNAAPNNKSPFCYVLQDCHNTTLGTTTLLEAVNQEKDETLAAKKEDLQKILGLV